MYAAVTSAVPIKHCTFSNTTMLLQIWFHSMQCRTVSRMGCRPMYAAAASARPAVAASPAAAAANAPKTAAFSSPAGEPPTAAAMLSGFHRYSAAIVAGATAGGDEGSPFEVGQVQTCRRF